MMNLSIIILAAGKGTRMRSNLPKVIQPLANKPMLQHVLDSASSLNPNKICVITGYQSERVQAAINNAATITWVEQAEQLGTGHAVQQALPELPHDGVSLILYGDVPLISAQTLQRMSEAVSEKQLVLLTQLMADPTGYGRIVRNDDNAIESIVEQKDASDAQLAINEINTGIMAAHNQHLHQLLSQIGNNNAQQEYYLTDLVGLAVENNISVQALHPEHDYETQGVNNKVQLAQLEREFQQAKAQQFLEAGLHIIDSARFDVRGSLQFGEDCQVDINAIFEGDVVLGDRVSIGPNCVIKNARIGSDVSIHANSVLDDCELASDINVGPFARLRPGAKLADGVRIGNFVEVKQSDIGVGSKVNHLSYIGDATIGKDSNIGAGTITCNYDGVNKHRTVIGDEVRIGSNSSLIAPISIGNKSTTGAGSALSKNIKDNTLAVGRGKERHIENWPRPEKD